MISRFIPTLKFGLNLGKFYSTTVDRVNYYEVLGVNSGATSQQIHEAYNVKSKIYNPDVDPAGFHKLSQAFVILTNGLSRDAYDSLLKTRVQSYINGQSSEITKPGTKGYLAGRKQEANRQVRKRMNIDQFGRYRGGLPKFHHYTDPSARGKAVQNPGVLAIRQDIENNFDKFPEFNIVDPQIAESFKNYQQTDREDRTQKPTWIKLQVDYEFFTFKKFRTVYWPYIRLFSFLFLILPIWFRLYDAKTKLAAQNAIRTKAGLQLL